MTAQPTLFPVGRARASDPGTSHEAAAGISGRTERFIAALFRSRPERGFTDDEICDALDAYASVTPYPPTVKSARSRLSRAGLLVDSGLRRPSNRGRAQVVWKLAP